MQDLKIYILIEDKEHESEVRIDGNLETLRSLFDVLRTEFAIPSLPVLSAEKESQLQPAH